MAGEKLLGVARHPTHGEAAPERTARQTAFAPGAGGHADPSGKAVRLRYMPGLDGLRALAVIAVLLYHGDPTWLPGGFLGVEVFFVISGYLITALLLAEWRRSGRIDLKAFWFGRARRLLPALYVVLVVTLAYAAVFLPGEVAGLVRGDGTVSPQSDPAPRSGSPVSVAEAVLDGSTR